MSQPKQPIRYCARCHMGLGYVFVPPRYCQVCDVQLCQKCATQHIHFVEMPDPYGVEIR